MNPTACGLDAGELATQLERYRAIGRVAAAVERGPGRVVVQFAEDPPSALIERTLEVERGCCPFFEVVYDPDTRLLAISAEDPERRHALDAIAQALTESPANGGIQIAVERADADASLALQRAFFSDIATRYPGWEPGSSQPVEPSDLAPPDGIWLVAYRRGRAIGCGGLQRLDAETGEVRRIFLDPAERGRGTGRRLLAELEDHARRLGYMRVRLTTGDGQPEALQMFQSAGYQEVAPFTDGVFTRHWMEKAL